MCLPRWDCTMRLCNKAARTICDIFRIWVHRSHWHRIVTARITDDNSHMCFIIKTCRFDARTTRRCNAIKFNNIQRAPASRRSPWPTSTRRCIVIKRYHCNDGQTGLNLSVCNFQFNSCKDTSSSIVRISLVHTCFKQTEVCSMVLKIITRQRFEAWICRWQWTWWCWPKTYQFNDLHSRRTCFVGRDRLCPAARLVMGLLDRFGLVLQRI